MTAWLQTIAVAGVIFCSIVLANRLARVKGRYWLIGYCLPLVLIGAFAMARFANQLNFVWPISWLMAGRVRFVALAVAVPFGIITPLPRLKNRRAKVALVSLMAVTLFWFSLMPFLSAAVLKPYFTSLDNRMTPDGVCYQTTRYTCGPAAAVTALKRLNLPAHEGTIAVMSYTTPMTGTLPGSLASAISRKYAHTDLRASYEHLSSLDDLGRADASLAMIRSGFFSDHCVAVLEVSQSHVTYADPIYGVHTVSRDEFKQMWRSAAILLNRPSSRTAQAEQYVRNDR